MDETIPEKGEERQRRLTRHQRRVRAKRERRAAMVDELYASRVAPMEEDDGVSQDVSIAAAPAFKATEVDHEQQQQTRRGLKSHTLASPSPGPETKAATEDAAQERLLMKEPLQDDMQTPDTEEARTDRHDRATTTQGFPYGTREEQSSGITGRERQKRRARADRGNGHGFGIIGCGAKHIRFDDDGVTGTAEHCNVGQSLLLEKEMASQSEAFMDEPEETKTDKEDICDVATVGAGSTNVLPHSDVNMIETLPDDVFFAIFDYLSNPLIAYKYLTRPQTAKDYNSMFKYNSSPGVLDSIASNHPYLQLSLTSRKLRDQVEAYCHHAFQRTLISIMPNAEARLKSIKVPEQSLTKKVKRAQAMERKAKMLGGGGKVWRVKWLNLAWKRCSFCGRRTMRRAVFDYITWCCRKCDDKHWPKMKRTEATAHSTILSPIHLDTPDLILNNVNQPVLAFDWATQQTYVLREEIERLEERIRKEDPDMRRTHAAELEEAKRLNTFGGVKGLGRDAKKLMKLWGTPVVIPEIAHQLQ